MSSFVFVSCWNCFDCKLLDHTTLHLDIMLTARNSNPGPTRCTARPLTQTHTHTLVRRIAGVSSSAHVPWIPCVLPPLCFCVFQSSYSSCAFRCLPLSYCSFFVSSFLSSLLLFLFDISFVCINNMSMRTVMFHNTCQHFHFYTWKQRTQT